MFVEGDTTMEVAATTGWDSGDGSESIHTSSSTNTKARLHILGGCKGETIEDLLSAGCSSLSSSQPLLSNHTIKGKQSRTFCRMVLVFKLKFTLEDAIEFHAFAPLEALPCV
jgi:hypothetical protein